MLDFSRFEILTFDCYGTLINWEEGILRCMRRILAAHGKDKDDNDDATILQFYGDFEARAEQGTYRCYREVLQSVVKQFGEQLGFAAPTTKLARCLSPCRIGSPGRILLARLANFRNVFDWPLFPTWMTTFSPPPCLSWE